MLNQNASNLKNYDSRHFDCVWYLFLLFRQNELYFLECDVGQSEFTPPGLISLNRVSSPVLGLYMQ